MNCESHRAVGSLVSDSFYLFAGYIWQIANQSQVHDSTKEITV